MRDPVGVFVILLQKKKSGNKRTSERGKKAQSTKTKLSHGQPTWCLGNDVVTSVGARGIYGTLIAAFWSTRTDLELNLSCQNVTLTKAFQVLVSTG